MFVCEGGLFIKHIVEAWLFERVGKCGLHARRDLTSWCLVSAYQVLLF